VKIMVKVWTQDSTRHRFTIAEPAKNSPKIPQPWTFRPLAESFPKPRLNVSGRYVNDFFVIGSWRVVSARLKEILEHFQVKAEYFETTLFHKAKPYAAQKFYFLHLMDQVEAIDPNRSDVAMSTTPGFTDFITSVEKLAIQEKKAKGHPMFRIAKCFVTIICVCDALAAAVENAGVTGARFVEPSEWRWGMLC
jgi:hypothetical protein